MKKFIILGLVVLFTFLSAQGLHEIKKPMRVLGWVKIGGDLLPIWTEKYDVGSENYWFDSSFIAHGWFKYLRVDSGGYLKLDSADYSTLTADSVYTGELVVEGNAIFQDTIDISETYIMQRQPLPLITFVFDDGSETDYTVMKPLFDAQGEIAVIAPNNNAIGLANRLTWAQILELQTAGWEIASHTYNHANLGAIDADSIAKECTLSINEFAAHGITVNNIAYPGGSSNVLARNIVRRYFHSGRAIDAGGYACNPRYLQPYQLRACCIDPDEDSLSFKGHVDTAEADSIWLIFYAHETDSNDSLHIARLIDYIQGKGISIVTLDQALDYGKGMRIGGTAFNEESDWWFTNGKYGWKITSQGTNYHKAILDEISFGGTSSLKGTQLYSQYNWTFGHSLKTDLDFIFKSMMPTENTDFFQIQDSAGTVVAKISNRGDLTVSGDVKAGTYSFCLWKNIDFFGSGTQNTISGVSYLDAVGGVSFDSLIIDSVFILGYAYEDTNKVDSLYLACSRSRTYLIKSVVADGTDWGSDGHCNHTYTDLNITVPTSSYYVFRFKPKAESATNKMMIANIIIYGHPQ